MEPEVKREEKSKVQNDNVNEPFFTLFLGFLLGVKHAFEADHVIAVSTIAAEQKNPFTSSLIGTFWGIGHTTTLFLIGLLVLLLKLSIPEKASLVFELFVGVMLILLGLRVLFQVRNMIHSHVHVHGKRKHEHTHVHSGGKKLHYHHRSFFIGIIHGLAGSGALMILVLSTINSLITGLFYIIIFGLGSILGMTIMSFFIGIPFFYAGKHVPAIDRILRLVAGLLSIVFGIYMIYQIGRAL